MYCIIKHKSTEKYYGVRRVFVKSPVLAHRFGSVRRARSYIANNGLNSCDFSVITVIPHEDEEEKRFSAQQITNSLFGKVYGRNKEW